MYIYCKDMKFFVKCCSSILRLTLVLFLGALNQTLDENVNNVFPRVGLQYCHVLSKSAV